MKTLRSENGFTLIEAMVAMAILSIGILSLYTMQISSIRGNMFANGLTVASTLAAAQIEQIMSRPIAEVNNLYINNDVKDKGQIAAIRLNDTTNPDSTITVDKYDVYVNVEPNTPTQNVTQVRTIVQWRGGQVVTDYFKSR